jgi:hypothetical protein
VLEPIYERTFIHDSYACRKGKGTHAGVKRCQQLKPHVREFDITGRPMKGWVVVSLEGVQHDDQLKGWIQRAVKFVGKLPAKEK